MPESFDTASRENTMTQGVQNSSYMCVRRLKRRYANINFEHCASELCYFLRRQGDQNNFLDKFRVAERALYPDFGAVGSNPQGVLEKVLYYWMAANDESPSIQSTPDDRRACFVRALYESQRGNNAAEAGSTSTNSALINFVDNGSMTDVSICHWGVANKFAEVFVGMHPDIQLIAELHNRITELLQGFVAEYAFSQGITHENLVTGNFDCAAVFTPEVRQQIRTKVSNTLGYLSENDDGLMSASDVRFLNDSLLVLEDLGFNVILRGVAQPENLSEQALNNLILDANNQLQQELRARNNRAVMARAVAGQPLVPFNYAQISTILRQILPVPNNRSHLYGDNWFEDRHFTPGQNTVTRTRRGALPSYMNIPYQYNFYLHGEPTAAVLAAAMQPQPTTITPAQASNVRTLRFKAQGII